MLAAQYGFPKDAEPPKGNENARIVNCYTPYSIKLCIDTNQTSLRKSSFMTWFSLQQKYIVLLSQFKH